MTHASKKLAGPLLRGRMTDVSGLMGSLMARA
jgi:hypothetical protein